MSDILCTSVAIVLFTWSVYLIRRYNKKEPRDRLTVLAELGEELDQHREDIGLEWGDDDVVLNGLQDRLGRAGFFSKSERRFARNMQNLLIGGSSVFGIGAAFYIWGSLGAALAGALAGLYLSVMLWLYLLRYWAKEVDRELLFQLPLLLEAMILLVESGLGVLPAIQQVVSVEDEKGRKNPALRVLRLVYELASHGVPFGNALELVADAVDAQCLRHVLLHLDISATEGGELVPSLRNLSDHTHTEWRLSVETRVKRLENMVVFPVFASVLGLILLTAAVPLSPVLDFMGSLDAKGAANRAVIVTDSESRQRN